MSFRVKTKKLMMILGPQQSTIVSPSPWFCTVQFQSTAIQIYQVESSRNK
jgi:hypothetical protein